MLLDDCWYMDSSDDRTALEAQEERLNRLMASKGYRSLSALAKAAGIAPSTLNRKVRGTDQSLISTTTWTKLERAPHVSGVNHKILQRETASPVTLTEAGAGMVGVAEVDVRSSAGGGAVVDYEEESLSWGFPASFVQAELRARAEEIRIITNEGDSMVSDPPKPTDIQPGDKLVVRISDRTPSPPGIFIVHDGLGLVTKRVVHVDRSDPPTIRFFSNNPNYEPYERTLEEAHIMGRVIGRWQRF